jgi:threonine/homoserine/homoserine lactone efflux protein
MLPETPMLLVFLIAGLLLIATPGPAVIYIITRSVEQGRAAGLVSTAGISAGTLVHVTATSLGLSLLFSRTVWAVQLVQYLGSAYLIYLGAARIIRGPGMKSPRASRRQSYVKIFWQGMLVNLLNPKTTLFFLSFLPQFVDLSKGSLALQVFSLGIILVTMGLISDGAYAFLAGTVGSILQKKSGLQSYVCYTTGIIYITLGIAAACWQL